MVKKEAHINLGASFGEGNAHQNLAIKILNEMLLDDCKSEWVKPLSKILPYLNLKRNVSDQTINDIRRLSKNVIMRIRDRQAHISMKKFGALLGMNIDQSKIAQDSDAENRVQSKAENVEDAEQREYDDLANQISEATSTASSASSSIIVLADRRSASTRPKNKTPPIKVQPKLEEKQLARRLIKLDLNTVDPPTPTKENRRSEKSILKPKNNLNNTDMSSDASQTKSSRSPTKRSLRSSSSSSSTQSSTRMSLRSSKTSSNGTPRVKKLKK